MKRRQLDGLRKRCECGQRKWAKCKHPWHFQFFVKRCSCLSSTRCPHHAQNHVRYSLHKVANKLPSYVMSKTEAEAWRDRLRADIRQGRFKTSDDQPATRYTVDQLADRYVKEHVYRPGRPFRSARAIEHHVNIIRRLAIPDATGQKLPFGQWPLDAVTADDLEAIRDARRAELKKAATMPGRHARPASRGGEIGVEHLMGRLRNMLSWAVKKGRLVASPFMRSGISIVTVKANVPRGRTRRLNAGEEELLLQHAGDHLRSVIIAALETGCRRGELLSLQWRHVHLEEGVIRLDAENTKTKEARSVPITQRLRAVLEMRNTDLDGQPFRSDGYVFGNEVGEPIGTVRTAWVARCRRAGITDLHFHDLRREFASRLLEAGAAHHDVRDWLGHANITTTSQYLKSTPVRLQKVKALFEKRTEKVLGSEGEELVA